MISCQNSTPCHHIREDNKYVFIVKLNTSQYENSEYLCLPDNGPVTFEVKGCSVAMEKHTEGKRVEKCHSYIRSNVFDI